MLVRKSKDMPSIAECLENQKRLSQRQYEIKLLHLIENARLRKKFTVARRAYRNFGKAAPPQDTSILAFYTVNDNFEIEKITREIIFDYLSKAEDYFYPDRVKTIVIGVRLFDELSINDWIAPHCIEDKQFFGRDVIIVDSIDDILSFTPFCKNKIENTHTCF